MRTTTLSLILVASLVATLAVPNPESDPAPEAEMKENSMDAPPMIPAPMTADPESPMDSARKGKFLLTGYPSYYGYGAGIQPVYPGHNRWGWILIGK